MKPVRLNMFTLVNDLSAPQFVTINVGTVTSNDTCVQYRIQYRFHTFTFHKFTTLQTEPT